MRALLLVALCAGVGCALALSPATGRTAQRSRHHRAVACHARRHHPCPKKHRHRRATVPHAPPPTGVGTAPAATVGPAPPAGTVTVPPPSTSTTTTTTPSALPSRLGVDEAEYTLRPTHDPVAAGVVQFNVENLGMDGHTFAISDAAGHQVVAGLDVPVGTTITVEATLAPGRYTLYCTLANHARLGMQSSLGVQ